MPTLTLTPSQASPFIITVLEGPLASKQFMADVPPGQIWLRGRSLPYRPITFKGKQRVKTTWLAGNPTATQQVMGPTEEPTTIKGWWKDKFLGNGVAMALGNMFTDLRRAGPLLQVTWGSGILAGAPQGSAIVRRGIISDVELTIERPQDVQFSMTFDWRGDDQAVAPATLTIGVENPRQGFANVKQGFTDMVEALEAFQTSAGFNALVNFPGQVVAEVDDVLEQANAMIDLIDNLSGLGATLEALPGVVVQRAIQVALAGAQSAQDLVDTALSLNLLVQIPVDLALDALGYENARFETVRLADSAKVTALATVNSLRGQAFPDVQAEVRPPPGTDLRDLALTFYGDPDLWVLIAQYNGIEGSRVPDPPTGPSDNPAPAILIPRRVEGELGQLNC